MSDQPAMPPRGTLRNPLARLADDALYMAGGAYPAKVKDLQGIAEDIERVLSSHATLEAALRKIAEGKVPPPAHGHYLAHREAVKVARAALWDIREIAA